MLLKGATGVQTLTKEGAFTVSHFENIYRKARKKNCSSGEILVTVTRAFELKRIVA